MSRAAARRCFDVLLLQSCSKADRDRGQRCSVLLYTNSLLQSAESRRRKYFNWWWEKSWAPMSDVSYCQDVRRSACQRWTGRQLLLLCLVAYDIEPWAAPRGKRRSIYLRGKHCCWQTNIIQDWTKPLDGMLASCHSSFRHLSSYVFHLS